ncbi:MAG: hypothetical protein UV58_C0015G0009 [Candidatus Wolfebacteria bacterium GW2011_GWC1_43_10]|uniref:Cytosolic protein n=2 Tax=Candidatus Wolfeibacteriota TaxID=1752735 RepID=A0A0G1C886_9BACT|nr:MAG: hypothetical protein UV58_C0015G0009 [Candidatus Wolfebacteria bacterium GW2011_GWC1_43_10]KKT23039.1 MAG: hypothetical protein UW08_C0001G0002 [Parcubacteria group bacterium GW2011_GWB1_43_8b]OGM90138.1 MAG: hypothetical protein A2108_02015 [Candidatus Wolfebacteria bacterium GWA1_42_9]
MDYQNILQQAIDLHIHIGPEIIPRKFTLPELVDYEKGKLKGIGVKNHFFSTIAMGKQSAQDGSPSVINSVVLNHYVGGFNPDIIRASAELSEKPIIVWFPTLHTEEFLQSQKFEIPEEWIDPKMRRRLKLRPTEKIKALSVFDNGKISKEVKMVLYSIKENGAILATGHLSWQESYELVKFAIEKIGIKKIVITHPIYQKIDMPIKIQKELAELGALIEHCYSMYSIDKIPMDKIAQQIKDVGADNCILSSDVGQTFSKSPSEALTDFISLLKKEGVTENEIKTMLIKNPERLVR